MNKKGKQIIHEEQNVKEEAVKEEQKGRQLRYVGKTINHFKHNGFLYQLIPNTVYLDLPDCEQVSFLIKNKELVEV